MIQKIILGLLLISGVHNFAQEYDEYGHLDPGLLMDSHVIGNPTVRTPDVAAFEKVNFIPVNNYTGRANISVPIYNIKVGKMEVPISLMYNSSGVKVADMPSNVGTNWALNAGGVLSRTRKGIKDEWCPHPLSVPWGFHSPKGWACITDIDPRRYENDPEPDIVTVAAPDLSTKYFNNPNPVEIERNGNKIIDESKMVPYTYFNEHLGKELSIEKPGRSVKITSLKGIVYLFESYEVTQNKDPEGKYHYNIDSFKLDRMYDPSSNQAINFKYEVYTTRFKDRIQTGDGKHMFTRVLRANRLTNITFDGGEVKFIYNHNRQDNPDEKALTEVKVFNHVGELVKRVKLVYSYFQSAVDQNRPQSKRLRLDRVFQVDKNAKSLPGYTFSYETGITVPPRDSWAHDFLGYNNGSYNASIVDPSPKLYLDMSLFNSQNSVSVGSTINRTYSIVTPIPKDGRRELGRGNFSLVPDEDKAKAYSLKRITYSTGGYTEIEYEGNAFRHSNEWIVGGGLRVSSQKTVDEYGQEQILDYEYSGGKIGGIPPLAKLDHGVVNNATNLTLFKKYNTPQGQVELTDGAFVGYANVTITNRINNGRTIYQYAGYDQYPNLHSDKTVFGSNTISNSYNLNAREWRAYGGYNLMTNRDILRGKILSKTVFDQNGMMKNQVNYTYRLKNFRNITLNFENKVGYKNSGSNCYNPESGYFRRCGGFDETVKFPIDRNLVQTIEYKTFPAVNEHTPVLQGGIPKDIKNAFTKKVSYQYHHNLPLAQEQTEGIYPCVSLNEETYSCSDEETEYIKRFFTYPTTTSNLGQQNRLETPLEIRVENKNGLLKREEHSYSFFDNILAPRSIFYYARDESQRIPATVSRRDTKGNILEIRSEEGIRTSFIFGYGSRYMIGSFENTSYTQLTAALSEIGFSISQISNSSSSSYIQSITDQLRDHLTNSRVISHTYKPLVGITSTTDIRGRTTTYEYDSFHRLLLIRDHEGNIVSKNTYNYYRP